MLSDDDIAETAGLDSYYECSWLGMAVAYRDYLEKPLSEKSHHLLHTNHHAWKMPGEE